MGDQVDKLIYYNRGGHKIVENQYWVKKFHISWFSVNPIILFHNYVSDQKTWSDPESLILVWSMIFATSIIIIKI